MRLWLLLLAACSTRTVSSTSKVEVTSPGNEPRQLLAYKPGHVDRKLTYAITPGRAPEVAMHLTVDWSCSSKCKYDVLTYSQDEPFPIDSQERAVRDRLVDAVESQHGEVRVTADGALEMETPKLNIEPSFVELLRLLVVPLPKTPVGVGAKWTAKDGELERTYTLVGDRVVDFNFEMSPQGTSVTGHGHVTFDLSDPAGAGTITQTIHFAPDADGDVEFTVQ